MLGDAKTISAEDNKRESQPFDAPGQWSTPSSPAGHGPSIAPSWDTVRNDDAAATIESNGWSTADDPSDTPPAAEPRDFAGWGGLANPDPAPVSQDLSGWDSPSAAVLAEFADDPWGFRATDETHLRAVERDQEALPSAWAELPDPASSSPAAWDPAPPPSESEASLVGWTDDAAAWADPVAFAPFAGESPETDEPIFEVEAADDVATTPATAEHSEAVVKELAGSQVAFHTPATEVADDDAAPLGRPTADFESAAAVVPTSDDTTAPAVVPTLTRRGRLAARSAARSAGPVAMELETPNDAIHDDVANHLATSDSPQPHSFGPGSQPDDGVPADDASPSGTAFGRTDTFEPSNVDEIESAPQAEVAASMEPRIVGEVGAGDSPTETALTPSIEPANVDDATVAARSRGARRSFFARRAPGDTATSSGETPKALRIAAVVSLVVGLGLFGFSVVTDRSSGSKPTVVTTPPAAAPQAPDSTLPTAPVAEATLAADPIFGANDTFGSPTVRAGVTVAPDPIFGSEQTGGSQTVTTGATVVIDPSVGSSDATSTVDPIFGSSTAGAAKVEGVTVPANDELAFEQPAKVSR